jgi:hypothetical protein
MGYNNCQLRLQVCYVHIQRSSVVIESYSIFGAGSSKPAYSPRQHNDKVLVKKNAATLVFSLPPDGSQSISAGEAAPRLYHDIQ